MATTLEEMAKSVGREALFAAARAVEDAYDAGGPAGLAEIALVLHGLAGLLPQGVQGDTEKERGHATQQG